jgi:hypothetical protein
MIGATVNLGELLKMPDVPLKSPLMPELPLPPPQPARQAGTKTATTIPANVFK